MSKRVLLPQLTAVSLAFEVSGLCHYESCCSAGDGGSAEGVIRNGVNLADSLSMLILFLSIGIVYKSNALLAFRVTKQDKHLNRVAVIALRPSLFWGVKRCRFVII